MLLTLVAPTLHVLTEHEDHDHHTHGVEVCTKESELDPCHRRLVHHENDINCGHEAHLFEAEWHCDWCDSITPRNYLTLELEPFEWDQLILQDLVGRESADVLVAEILWNRGRAPPVLV